MATQSLSSCSKPVKRLLPVGGTPARRASRLRPKLDRLEKLLGEFASTMRDVHPDHRDDGMDEFLSMVNLTESTIRYGS